MLIASGIGGLIKVRNYLGVVALHVSSISERVFLRTNVPREKMISQKFV